MSRLFWMPFHPADWLHDTRRLTPAARGLWIDLLCCLWPTGTNTLSEAEWIRELSVTPEEFRRGLDELNHGKTADVTERDNLVTVECRRMLREHLTRESTRLRMKAMRERRKLQPCDAIELKLELDLESQKKKEKRGSAFPDGFAFEPKHEAIAKGFGLNVHAEFAQFKDHHLAKGTVFKDWNAAFRTWLRNAVTFKQKGRR